MVGVPRSRIDFRLRIIVHRVPASVPIPKFAHPCGNLECELRNQRDTSNFMILVPLLNPKFANTLAARSCELRVRGTSCHAPHAHLLRAATACYTWRDLGLNLAAAVEPGSSGRQERNSMNDEG